MSGTDTAEPEVTAGGLPRLRILHLLAPAPFGGLEQVVLSLAAAQRAAGHDVHVGAVLEPDADHPVLAALGAAGVHTYALRLPIRAYRRERAVVRDLCADLRPDIVHTHGYHVDVLHGPVVRKLGIPCVSTAHGFIGGAWKNRLYEHLQRRAFRRCEAVVAVSKPMAEGLAAWGIPEEQVHWIPNAWTDSVSFLERGEARLRLGMDPDAFSVGFIGRIGREKGPDVLVEALGELNGGANAVFIGDGRMRPELMARAEAMGLGDSIQWAGLVPGAARLMKAFDMVVLSSRTEGTPVVLLEAMAAGVPVAATRVGGIPDVVSEGEAALVAPEDPGALAAAIRDVMEDRRGAARRAARAGSRLRQELGADRWLDRYDRVYAACGVSAAGPGAQG